MIGFDLKTAEEKTDMLKMHLRLIKDILDDCFIKPEQRRIFDDFESDVVAVADADIQHIKKMQSIVLWRHSGQQNANGQRVDRKC